MIPERKVLVRLVNVEPPEARQRKETGVRDALASQGEVLPVAGRGHLLLGRAHHAHDLVVVALSRNPMSLKKIKIKCK